VPGKTVYEWEGELGGTWNIKMPLELDFSSVTLTVVEYALRFGSGDLLSPAR
jgi:hypothetical protein